MSGTDDAAGPGRDDWWRPAQLLTAHTSATVAFTFAVLSMLGQGAWTMAAQSFTGTTFAPSEFLVTGGVASLALAVGALWLGRRVLVARATAPSPWAAHLAGAAVVVGALGALLAILTIIGAALG
jgi:hypothetical protein